MDFQRSEDEKMVRQHAPELARRALAEHAMERQDSVVPPERITLLTSSGLLGLTTPTRVGGSERAYLESVLAVEAVSPTRPVTVVCLSRQRWFPSRTLGIQSSTRNE
jgi:alkylation response protein AidB-like acyl-CoA dehydrogenase